MPKAASSSDAAYEGKTADETDIEFGVLLICPQLSLLLITLHSDKRIHTTKPYSTFDHHMNIVLES
jgi:hypothetical protein